MHKAKSVGLPFPFPFNAVRDFVNFQIKSSDLFNFVAFQFADEFAIGRNPESIDVAKFRSPESTPLCKLAAYN